MEQTVPGWKEKPILKFSFSIPVHVFYIETYLHQTGFHLSLTCDRIVNTCALKVTTV